MGITGGLKCTVRVWFQQPHDERAVTMSSYCVLWGGDAYLLVCTCVHVCAVVCIRVEASRHLVSPGLFSTYLFINRIHLFVCVRMYT